MNAIPDDLFHCYTKLKPFIDTVVLKPGRKNFMSFADAMAEGVRASALAKKYRNELLSAGIDASILDTMYERSGAFAYCVSVMDSHVAQSSKERLQDLVKKSITLRKELMILLKFAYRQDPETISSLANLVKGRRAIDLSSNLRSCALLAAHKPATLIAVNADMTQFTHAQELSEQLATCLSECEIMKDSSVTVQTTVYKALYYMFESINAIYEAGKFYFSYRNNSETASLFVNSIMKRRKVGKRKVSG